MKRARLLKDPNNKQILASSIRPMKIKLYRMRQVFFVIGFVALTLFSCNSAKKRAAKAEEEAQIRKIDSLVTKMDSLKQEIDSSSAYVDDLIEDL